MFEQYISEWCAINPAEYKGMYSTISNNYEVGTLAVGGWSVTFGTPRRGLDGAVLCRKAKDTAMECD